MAKQSDFFTIYKNPALPHQLPKYLEFTAIMMQLCSDIPSIFNFRRQLIQTAVELKEETADKASLLSGEIKLTTKLIQSDQKSYTLWSYRQWLVIALTAIKPEIVVAEKELCKMLLLKDEKNFHVWNYRNWVNSLQVQTDEEITFTEEKIKLNPFNFSPYHFRSKLFLQKYTQTLNQESPESLK